MKTAGIYDFEFIQTRLDEHGKTKPGDVYVPGAPPNAPAIEAGKCPMCEKACIPCAGQCYGC